MATVAGDFFETTLGRPAPRPFFETAIDFSYQRYDIRVIEDDWLSFVYFTSLAGATSVGNFYSSGMSAIADLFSVIRRCGWNRIGFSGEPYYETWLLLERFFPDFDIDQTPDAFSNEREVLFLDTSSLAWPALPESRGELELVVVDTSCVACTSEDVARWVEHCRSIDIPVALVRSHIKLDSFGLEPGRIGSLVLVADDDDVRGDLEKHLRQARSVFGSAFSPASFYPWIGNREFGRLSRERTDRIRLATDILCEELQTACASDEFVVTCSTHGIFLLVDTGLAAAVEAEAGGRVLGYGDASSAIATAAQAVALPVHRADSFGLDVVTLTDYVNIFDGRHKLRVSGADLPSALLPDIARVIRDTLDGLLEHHAVA